MNKLEYYMNLPYNKIIQEMKAVTISMAEFWNWMVARVQEIHWKN